jgi:hypothetical protein
MANNAVAHRTIKDTAPVTLFASLARDKFRTVAPPLENQSLKVLRVPEERPEYWIVLNPAPVILI